MNKAKYPQGQIALRQRFISVGLIIWVLFVNVVFYRRLWDGYGSEVVSLVQRLIAMLGGSW